jgi:hypothetical protein
MRDLNNEYAPSVSSDATSQLLGFRRVRYGRYTWPSYSVWIVPGTEGAE